MADITSPISGKSAVGSPVWAVGLEMRVDILYRNVAEGIASSAAAEARAAAAEAKVAALMAQVAGLPALEARVAGLPALEARISALIREVESLKGGRPEAAGGVVALAAAAEIQSDAPAVATRR